MKVIFNDATEITVQQVESRGDYLRVLTVGTTAEQLKVLFTDSSRPSRMIVQERGQTIATYEGYTVFYRTEIYTGQIYGVMMYKQETLPEAQSAMVQAAILVAQMQAQSLPDEQAISVKDIYPVWDSNGVSYAEGYKVLHNNILYKCISDHTSQADWAPGAATSLWVAVSSGEHAGTKEDPIPVPDTVMTAGMEYEKGKYYIEGGTVYLMDRTGMNTGETVKLYFAPSALLGQYFSVE